MLTVVWNLIGRYLTGHNIMFCVSQSATEGFIVAAESGNKFVHC